MSGKTYKIYINQAALIITEEIPEALADYQFVDSQSFEFADFYKRAVADARPVTYILQTANSKRFFKSMRSSVVFIKAAGGVVRNEEDSYLFIFRKGKWDLPKGKLDDNEKPKKAAVREVEEECGIKVARLGQKLCNTYHAYQERGSTVLKKTSWYVMEATKDQKLVPQHEEDITEVSWVAADQFGLIMSNTFPLIKDVVKMLN